MDAKAQWPEIAKVMFSRVNGANLKESQINLFVGRLALGRRDPDPTLDCWEWGGQYNLDRYGVWDVYDVNGKRRSNFKVHRLAHELATERIPQGYVVHHTCGNRSCCNPAHLEAISHTEHSKREFSTFHRSMSSTHCKNGHEYTPENTSIRRGHRHCLACQRNTSKLRYERFKQKHGIVTVQQEDRTHCVNGHEFTPENIYWYRGESGNFARSCKECRKTFKKAYEQRRHEEILQMRRDRYQRTYKASKGLIDGAGI